MDWRALADLLAEADRALAGEHHRSVRRLRDDLIEAVSQLHYLAGQIEATLKAAKP